MSPVLTANVVLHLRRGSARLRPNAVRVLQWAAEKRGAPRFAPTAAERSHATPRRGGAVRLGRPCVARHLAAGRRHRARASALRCDVRHWHPPHGLVSRKGSPQRDHPLFAPPPPAQPFVVERTHYVEQALLMSTVADVSAAVALPPACACTHARPDCQRA